MWYNSWGDNSTGGKSWGDHSTGGISWGDNSTGGSVGVTILQVIPFLCQIIQFLVLRFDRKCSSLHQGFKCGH